MIFIKIQSFKKEEEDNFAVKQMYKMLDEANLNSCDEILELQAKEFRLANNFDICNSLQLSLDNLNTFENDRPSVSALIFQTIN